MTADSVDLEDANCVFKELIGTFMYDDVNNQELLESDSYDPGKYAPIQYPLNSFSDVKNLRCSSIDDVYSDLTAFQFGEYNAPLYEDPFGDDYSSDCKMRLCDSEIIQNSSLFDLEDYLRVNTLVSPDLILPNSVTSSPVVPNPILPPNVKEEEDSGDEAVDSIWPEVSELTDIKLLNFVDGGYLGDELVPVEELFRKKKRRKLTHLDFDHCYSQPPIEEDDEEDDEDDEYDYFNSPLYSPASSSCSDKTRGVKRSRQKRKAVKHIKIKQEIISSDEEEVDVETPCPISLVVPKITISLAPPPVKAKRGRKPKNKTEGLNVKKSNKNCPVSPKDLQAAIKQQKQKIYITKSGRVSNKISNSVETTPSTSTHSSVSNSRCNSDNEDTVDKRASHNMAERNRRQELTNLFQNLRKKVPEIEKNLKASKVLILQSAASHIGHLERIEKTKVSYKQQLRAEIDKKMAMMQSLKNSRCFS